MLSEFVTLVKNRISAPLKNEDSIVRRQNKLHQANNYYPVSVYQNSILIHENYGINYMMAFALQISGYICINKIKESIIMLIKRHKILQTKFKITTDGFKQYINDKKISINQLIKYFDVSSPIKHLDQFIEYTWQHEDNINANYLFYASILTSSHQQRKTHAIIAIRVHHALFDDSSLILFMKEIASIYHNLVDKKNLDLPQLAFQYSDFCQWQNMTLSLESNNKENDDYWSKLLSNYVPLQLPHDFNKPNLKFSICCETLTLTSNIIRKISQLAARQKTSKFIIYLTAFVVFIYKYTYEEDFCIAVPCVDRQLPGTETLIGLFVDALILRFKINKNLGILPLIQLTKTFLEEAIAHQCSSNKPKNISNQNVGPPYNVMFVMQNVPEISLNYKNFTLSICRHLQSREPFDLVVSISERENCFITWKYNQLIFAQSTIQRMMNHYCVILQKIACPSLIPSLS